MASSTFLRSLIVLFFISLPFTTGANIKNGNKIAEIVISPSYEIPAEYQSIVSWSAHISGIPEWFLARVIASESGFIASARHENKNGTIDIGICQFNSAYLEDYARQDNSGIMFDPADAHQAIVICARALSRLYRKTGSLYLAACAYNCGLGATLRGNIPESTASYAMKITLDNYFSL